MSPPNGDPSDLDRQASTRRSIMSDATDDDYDLNAMAVSDGFRPGDASQQPAAPVPAPAPSSHPNPQGPLPTLDPVGGISQKLAADVHRRPSSITKAHRPHDSLTLRNDGLNSGAASNIPPASDPAASGSHIVRMESPYEGPSGPSHPYALYAQRTLSNLTVSTDASTLGASQQFPGQAGPSHPYTLYTQHTTPVHEGSQQHIPLGFTAMAGGYQRQLGPDGEDAGGLIGPLGHTEELPPYTRYPTEAFTRRDVPSETATPISAPGNGAANGLVIGPSADTPSTPDTDSNSQSRNSIPGAGGIGIATRNPEYSSTEEDLPRPRSIQSSRTMPSDSSHHDINAAARDISEKPSLKGWRRVAKKKMCGIIPYWAIGLLLFFIVAVAGIMGGVLSKILGTEEAEQQEEEYTRPAPVLPDPLSELPPGLPALAVGSFGLPMMEPEQTSRSCFNDSTEAQAWGCSIPGRTFSMSVSMIPNASETENYELTLAPFNATNSKYIWGTAPPNIPEPMALRLVNDTFEPGRSPAWWMMVTYNKTVIVSENDFKTASGASKRSAWTYEDYPEDGFGHTQFKKKSTTAVDGDKPWICTWPETTLEIFIFPSQNSSLVLTTTTSGFAAPTPTATSASESASATPNLYRPYPRMIKFLERRRSGDFEPAPSCRQVEVFSGGHQDRPVVDEYGKPKIVEIVENDRAQLLEKLSNNDKREEFGALRLRDNGLELTDCGCLWRMT
jgi:hypothetical protein